MPEERRPDQPEIPKGTPITMTVSSSFRFVFKRNSFSRTHRRPSVPQFPPSPPSPPSPPIPQIPYVETGNGNDRRRERERETLQGIKDKNENREQLEQKRMTCKFCERMLENAKRYAVTTKSDITSFANNACAQMQKGRTQDQCYKLVDKKIDELAKFVDHQVIEALWCAELNHC